MSTTLVHTLKIYQNMPPFPRRRGLQFVRDDFFMPIITI